MEDLSHLLRPGRVTVLVPTAQSPAGSESSSNANAQTAPGSGPEADAGAPVIRAVAHEPATLTRGDDAGLDGGRPVLVRGGWNDMGGGPAPEGYRR